MAREVTLVDAGLGNLASVERALVQVGAGVRVTRDPDKVATSRMVVFPGQSAFGAATKAVVDGAMGAALRMVIERGDPFLGICLGMQLLFDGSDESKEQEGLHVMEGWCRRLPDDMTAEAEPGAKEMPPPVPAAPIPATAMPPQSVATSVPGTAMPPQSVAASVPGTAPVAAAAGVGTQAAASASVDTDALFASTPNPSPAPAPVASTPPSPSLIATAPVPSVATPEPATNISVPSVPLIRKLKVPHMGWNEVEPTGDHYYFVHSYYVEPKNSDDVMWMTTYGDVRFPAAVRRDNVMGCQFHPEKSQRAGLRFLRAFLLGGWG